MDEILKRIVQCIGPKHGAKKELADHLGITANVITNWLNGRNHSYVRYLGQIAEYYGVTEKYLRTGEKEKPTTQSDDELNEYLEELKNRPEMRMLFSVTKGATKEDVEKAVRIVEAALGK